MIIFNFQYNFLIKFWDLGNLLLYVVCFLMLHGAMHVQLLITVHFSNQLSCRHKAIFMFCLYFCYHEYYVFKFPFELNNSNNNNNNINIAIIILLLLIVIIIILMIIIFKDFYFQREAIDKKCGSRISTLKLQHSNEIIKLIKIMFKYYEKIKC